MLADKREHIKKLAFRKILKIRQTSSGHAEIRVFKVSTIKYLVADADWKSITEHSQTKVINIQVIFEAMNDIDLICSAILDKFYQIH